MEAEMNRLQGELQEGMKEEKTFLTLFSSFKGC